MARKKSKAPARKKSSPRKASKKPAASAKKPAASAKRRAGAMKRRGKPARMQEAKPATTAAAPAPKPPSGSFVWHELMTTDAGAAKSFYSKLFGWKTEDQEMMPGFMYTTISNKGQSVGGMMALGPEHGDTMPHWMLYVSVKDVDATAAQAEAMGGEIVIPPHDIPVGRWAQIRDPSGAQIAIYKSKGAGRG